MTTDAPGAGPRHRIVTLTLGPESGSLGAGSALATGVLTSRAWTLPGHAAASSGSLCSARVLGVSSSPPQRFPLSRHLASGSEGRSVPLG